MTQIALSSVAVEFGTTVLLRDVSFVVAQGEKWGLVGRNGTGKTTLVRVIAGQLAPTRGAVSRPTAARIALLEQHRDFGDARTVWEAVASGMAELQALERSLADQAAQLAELGEAASPAVLDRYAHDLDRFEREGGYTMDARVDAVIQGLGFDPADARTRSLEGLSGGERGRVGLARQLVAPADVLVLDEPTNHLDMETTDWLEGWLTQSDRTVIVISHDRDFLANVVDHVLHVEDRTATAYVGGYEAFVAQRLERRLAQQRAFSQQQKKVAAEEDYIRRNIAGVNSRQAKGRRTRLARLPRLSPPPSEGEAALALRLEAAERGGEQVVVAERARIAVGDRILLDDFTATARRGDRIGLVGPNGAGKSTLLRAILGEHPVAGGGVRLGAGVRVAYYRQDLAQVPLDRTIYDAIAERRPLWDRGQIQGHLGRFGFSGDEVMRRAATLSGGERARVALALLMLARANVLVLDEPTNHLDVESIEALEDAIEQYDGTVLLVSHDRALLRALTTRVWALRDARITTFDGPFGEWEAVESARAREAEARAGAREAERRERERRERERADAQRRDLPDERGRAAGRQARRRVETAERCVTECEAAVAGLSRRLEDPALYGSPDGAREAARLGAALEEARRALDAAVAEWAAAEEAAATLVPDRG
ncbi:MAG TPA: ABC-F family ATP-binding cassette domain-containing protein [Gemmatimonadaceae bacterium]|nr:ABC-F family ATP-binding cassette domain-containing protein [Gemmatimonadaceae bacterium]